MRLGPKAYEQCAGFLRIRGGADPLDSSGVHPEAYTVVRRILTRTGGDVRNLVGNTAVLRTLRPQEFTDDTFGVPTVTDILAELEKPGRDPRPAFTTATFADGVEKIADLRVGMVLEGVVTNVAAFGAFVDVGVHQDGLVHVSAMSKSFVSDPRQVVTSGQVVKVKVMAVDEQRKRISLSLRLDDEPGAAGPSRPVRGRVSLGRVSLGRVSPGRVSPGRVVIVRVVRGRRPVSSPVHRAVSGRVATRATTASGDRRAAIGPGAAGPWPTPCAGPASGSPDLGPDD